MSDEFKPKVSLSEEMFSKFIGDTGRTNCNIPCEVFRNNTTAVEVIVKEIANKKKPTEGLQDVTIKRLENEVNKLKLELQKMNGALEKSRKGYKTVLLEKKNQLDMANERDTESRTKNLGLQLENEKLKCLLDSKTNLVDKLKKELGSMKRMVKVVIKGICQTSEITSTASFYSSLDYEDFEKDLRKDIKTKMAPKLFDGTRTFDSNATKEAKNSF